MRKVKGRMYSNKLYSPLRYPGGKSRFAPFVASLLQANGLCGGHYFEPYAGGAGVALELLFEGHVNHIHINDIDPAVHAFWDSIVNHSDQILDLLESTPITLDQWFYWRSILRGEIDVSNVEKGFATLFLNRTNRSGILKGGVIGGKSQAGIYKLDARFKKDVIRNRIEKISKYAENISVYCEDALSLLGHAEDFLPENTLIYLDPPYYIKGQELYRNFYTKEDHENIASILCSSDFKRHWMVSYDNVEEIGEMYKAARSLQYGLKYSAQKRYVGSEIMFFGNSLNLEDSKIESLTAA